MWENYNEVYDEVEQVKKKNRLKKGKLFKFPFLSFHENI